MREKLINLLSTAGWNLYTSEQAKQEIADHLIRNGVTIPVRCKDCMWFDTDDELADVFHKERHCFCTDVNTYVSENGFCSCGERKEQ
jgi:hypothetical protein